MASLTTIKTLELLEQEMGRAGRKTEEAALREARTTLVRAEPALLTTGQAARLLNVSIPTIKRMVRGGTLAGALIGGRWRVTSESVDASRRLVQVLNEIEAEGYPTPEEVQVLVHRARHSSDR